MARKKPTKKAASTEPGEHDEPPKPRRSFMQVIRAAVRNAYTKTTKKRVARKAPLKKK